MTAEPRPPRRQRPLTLGAIERLAASAARALALFGLGLLLLFAVATLFDGALRGLLNHPIESVRDLGGSVVAIAVACCLPLGLLERSNISIKVIDLWLPPAASRMLDALAAIVVQVIIFFIALEFYWYARDIAKSGETTLMLGIPTAPFWYAVDAILWLAALVQIVIVVADLLRCLGAAPPTIQVSSDNFHT
jgi:TRAP-type transport system small permease protein